MSDVIFLYVTAPNSETAARIGRTLIEEKLAACANISAEMRSIYEWEGRVEVQLETPMIIKTSAQAAPNARNRILELHPHDVPCIASLSVDPENSHAPFLDWVRECTKS